MRHDPQLKAVLQAFWLPVLRAHWAIDPAGCRDEVVSLIADDLGLPVLGLDKHPGPARRRGVTWHRHLRQVVSLLVYGHMIFERRYRYDPDGRLHLDNLGVRMPWTLASIKVNPDGTVREIEQSTQQQPIPANRLVWYGHELEGSNWAGVSLLRPAFGAWLLKHETWRVHATSIRRFGMGVPTVTAPAGATAGQVAEANRLASGMRVGDQAGAGMPPGFSFNLTGLTGSVPDALGFIRYLDQQMSKMALAGLIDLGQTETGSRALGETFLDLFILALQAVADDIADTATSGWPAMPGIVTDLVDVNWGEDEPAPRIVCTDVGEQHEITADSIAALVRFGAITPDPDLEAYLRQSWRLPQRAVPLPPDLVPRTLVTPAPPNQGPAGPGPAPGALANRRPLPLAAAANGLRRQVTQAEAQAGFDPAGMHARWVQELGWLISQWGPVFRAQRDQLAEQVAVLVDKGRLDKLAALRPDPDATAAGAQLLADAMSRLAADASLEVQQEAARQGVMIDPAKIQIPGAALAKIAAARAGLAGQYAAQQASRKALQVVKASKGTDAADQVTAALDALSPVSLRDQLGAALSAAQQTGRMATFLAGPPATEYVATEILDDGTCQECMNVDGTTFSSLADAEASYPASGYVDCAGGDRCRGTVVALWGGGD